VGLSVNYAVWDRQPSTVMFGLLSAPMHDRRMVNTAIDVQMPIFAPATWFLYAMRQRGLDISKLVTEYTREQIALQVTVLYFHCLALEESERNLESQVAAAEKMREEAGLYWEEGLLTQWQREYAEARALAQRNALEKTKRMQIEARARLSAAMGLSPTADLRLKRDLPLAAPEEALEDLLLQARWSHPTLRISDRNVAIQTNRIRIAIAEFLPKLAGLLNYSNTTNSMMKYADATMLGLGGVMTLFDGFANIREYQIARQEKKSAMVQREEACLTVMLAVIRAHLNLENARGDLVLAEKALAVASGRLTEIEAQSAEGLVKPSDRLSALADRDAAAANATNARFMEQISIATLRNLVGSAYTGDEGTDHAK